MLTRRKENTIYVRLSVCEPLSMHDLVATLLNIALYYVTTLQTGPGCYQE